MLFILIKFISYIIVTQAGIYNLSIADKNDIHIINMVEILPKKKEGKCKKGSILRGGHCPWGQPITIAYEYRFFGSIKQKKG